MPRPDPPIVFRRYLAASKRIGIPFDEAWDWTWRRTTFPNDGEHRRQWYAVMDELRPVWQAAYEDVGEIPGGAALVALADALIEEPVNAVARNIVDTPRRLAA